MGKQLILASASPRRREILTVTGYSFTVRPTDADENITGLTPDALVQELSLRKAKAALAAAGEDDVIVAADTVVALDGEILGKPKDADDAVRMLTALSGRSHSVFTGFTVCSKTQPSVTRVVEAKVTMRPLLPEEIAAYVATGSPLDKAGAYGMQEAAGPFVASIHGDYYSIVGLPICPLSVILRSFGITPNLQPANTTHSEIIL